MLDKLVLTQEEIDAEFDKLAPTVVGDNIFEILAGEITIASQAISLATVKKYRKWENEPCQEHWKRIIPHKDCLQCQEEITKALKEG